MTPKRVEEIRQEEANLLGVNQKTLKDPSLPVFDRELEEEFKFIGNPVRWGDISESDNKKEWLWENYIAKRHTTLLSALWKAGKTTFLRCLFVAMSHEEEFAGQPTKKCKVLVISEEAEGEWVDNREGLEKEEINNILVWSRPIRGKPNLKQWVALIKETATFCIEEKIDLVVIDTLTTFWPIDNENDSAQVAKALVPLYSFTEDAKCAVLLVHHFRKGGGEQAQASRGSGALPGWVDNIIEFTRSEDGMPTYRILKTYGRFDSVIPEIVIDYTEEGKYITKGEPWQVSKKARLEKIMTIIRENNRPLSSKEIVNIWNSSVSRNMTSRTIRNYLKELVSFGQLTTLENEVQGKVVPMYQNIVPSDVTLENGQTAPVIPFQHKNVLNLSTTKIFQGTFQGDPQNEPITLERKGTSVIPEDDNFPFE